MDPQQPRLFGGQIATSLGGNLGTVLQSVSSARVSAISTRGGTTGGFVERLRTNLTEGRGPLGMISIPRPTPGNGDNGAPPQVGDTTPVGPPGPDVGGGTALASAPGGGTVNARPGGVIGFNIVP